MLTLQVRPGVNLNSNLGAGVLTKKWVREVMRDHPEWDWRIVTPGYPTYVNGADCVRNDISLEVVTADSRTVAVVEFQGANDSLQAVVR